MSYTFGFIGCGNMGGALASAAAKSLPKGSLLLCDKSEEKLSSLCASLSARAASLGELVKEADYIVLGVKPQGIRALFDEIRPLLQKKDRFTLISMAAGVTLEALEKSAGLFCPIIRMMPNTPASVGEAMILYTANQVTTDADIEGFLSAFSAAGRFDRIPEGLIDAGGALSGCGPAFVYLFAEALADGAVSCGLPRDKALLYASQTLRGAAEMLLQSGRHPGELKDAVCSPGGTTIEGVKALEDGAFRATVMSAVTAAYQKTAKLK